MAAPDLSTPNLSAERVEPLRRERRALSREFFRDAVALAEVSADFLAATLSMAAALLCVSAAALSGAPRETVREAATIGAVFGMIVVVLMQRDGGYRSGSGVLRIQETERALRIPSQSLLLLFAICALLGRSIPVLALPIALLLIPAALIVGRQAAFWIAGGVQQQGSSSGRAVIYGAGSTGRSALSTLLHSPRLGLQPTAVIDDDAARSGRRISVMGYRGRGVVPVQPGPVTPAMLRSLECDLLLIATQNLTPDETESAISAAHQAGSEIAFLSGPTEEGQLAETIKIDGLLFTTTRRATGSWHYAVAKRVADLALSSILLVLLAPLLLLIAILIRFDSPGPALFVQKRVGRDGELFDIFKFRSMYVDAPKYSFSPMSSSDPRLTRMGRILRRISLDELPQLLNVLNGTMSLVGPRPEMPFIVERYNARDRQRLEVIPGITGLWQLSADRAFPIHQNIEYDLYYMRNRGFFMDMAILVHTLIFAMTGGI